MKTTTKLTVLLSMMMMSQTACNKMQFGLPDAEMDFAQTVTMSNKTDILILIDNSSSMDTYQNRLADQIPSMVSALNEAGMDYQIAFVTTDMRATVGSGGRFIGTPKILNGFSPTLLSQLDARIRLGTGGSDYERGFESIYTALSPSYLSGSGAGFLRDGALLTIMVLSNEDDQSDDNIASISKMKTRLNALKPPLPSGARSWVLNYIGIPKNASECSSALDGTYRDPGLRYIELAEASDGLVESICRTDLGDAVANIRQRIVQVLTDFHFDRRPILNTVHVTKNGQPVSEDALNGWTYERANDQDTKGFIRFHGTSIPGVQDQIHVQFDPYEST